MSKKTADTNHPTLSPKQVMVQLIELTINKMQNGQRPTPVMIHGKAGIGKSAIIAAFAKKHERPLIDIRLLLKEPTDIGGLPFFNTNEGIVAISDPAQFPPSKKDLPKIRKRLKNLDVAIHNMELTVNALDQAFQTAKEEDISGLDAMAQAERNLRLVELSEKLEEHNEKLDHLRNEQAEKTHKLGLASAVIIMDEITAASKAVQAAALQLVLDRKINDYELPDDVIMIGAGNRKGDGNVHEDMPVPLRNRFAHFDMESEFKDWKEWAATSGNIHPLVLGFLQEQSGSLYNYNADKRAFFAFATPRSWERASESLWVVSDETGSIRHLDKAALSRLKVTVGANVGIDVSGALMTYSETIGKLPPIADIASGKVTEWDFAALGAKKSQSAMFAFVLSSKHYINANLKRIERKVQDEGISVPEAKKLTKALCDKEITNLMVFMHKNMLKEKEFIALTLGDMITRPELRSLQSSTEMKELMREIRSMMGMI